MPESLPLAPFPHEMRSPASEPFPPAAGAVDFRRPLLMLCAEKAVALLPARAAAIFACDGTDGEAACVASAGDPPIAALGDKAALATNVPRAPSGLDPAQQRSAAPHGESGRVVAPLRVASRTVGMLVVERETTGWRETETLSHRLTHIADLCAATLDLAIQASQVAKNAQRALALEEILRELAAPLPLDRTLDTILKRTVELVPADLAFVILHDPEHAELVVTATLGATHPGLRGARVPVGAGLSVFTARRPLQVRDYRADPRVTNSHFRSLVDAESIRSFMGVPLAGLHEAVGSLCVCRRHVNPFDDDDAHILQSFGYHAAEAIERVRQAERDRAERNALSEAHQTLRCNVDVLHRLSTLQSRLADVVLDGGSLEGIVSTVAQTLGRIVSVTGPSFQALAHATALGNACGNNIGLGRTTGEALEQLTADDLHRERRVVRLPCGADAKSDAWYALAPVLAGEELLGYICAASSTSNFEQWELETLEFGAKAAALELLCQRARYSGQLHPQADLLADLIAGDQGSEAEMKHRALGLGYRLDQMHALFVVDVDTLSEPVSSNSNDERSVQRLRQALFTLVRETLEKEGLEGLLLSRSDVVMVALPAQAEETDPRRLARRVAARIQCIVTQRLPDVSLSIGVSRLCSGPSDFRQAYVDAQRALSVAKSSGRQGCVLCYDDLRMYRAVLESKDPASLQAMTREMLGPILALSPPKCGALLDTLKAFLQCNGSLRAAAAALYLHPHSLRYRLQRIQRLLDTDLSDAETRLHLHLALRIHRFLESGMFDASG